MGKERMRKIAKLRYFKVIVINKFYSNNLILNHELGFYFYNEIFIY
jgi:hypothetical protein